MIDTNCNIRVQSSQGPSAEITAHPTSSANTRSMLTENPQQIGEDLPPRHGNFAHRPEALREQRQISS
jgi:hypothetical protein